MSIFDRLGEPISPTSWDREPEERLEQFDDAGLGALGWYVIYAHIVLGLGIFAALMVLGG